MNIIGAIVYYFAVKRFCNCAYCKNKNYDERRLVCVCNPEAGICTCGAEENKSKA